MNDDNSARSWPDWQALEARPGQRLSGPRPTRVRGRDMESVLFENGAVFLDHHTNQLYELPHRETPDFLNSLREEFGEWELNRYEPGVLGVHAALLHTNMGCSTRRA